MIPHFGTAELGEIEVGENLYPASTRPCVYFELTMLKTKMGCIGDGNQNAGTTKTNGNTHP